MSGEALTEVVIRHQPHLHDVVVAVYAPVMALSGQDGQIRPGGAQGLFAHDVRALSELVMTVDGNEPEPLGPVSAGGATSRFYGVVLGAGRPGPDPTVLVCRERALDFDGMLERYTVESYAGAVVHCRLQLHLSSDLAGIGRVKSGLPTDPVAAVAGEGHLAWESEGRASVRAEASPYPAAITASSGTITWDLVVARGQAATVSLRVRAPEERAGPRVVAAIPRGTEGWERPEVRAGDQRLAQFVEQSLTDLEHLQMATPAEPEDVFIAAGAPWYLTLFGRDSIWAARMLLPLQPRVALGTLRALARRQGERVDLATSEEPGKILHELRRPLSQPSGLGAPGRPSLPPTYYGSVDATPLWVCLLYDAWKWGLPEDEVGPLLGPMQRCLQWVEEFGCGPDGFVRYVDKSGRGLTNQGWKDSWDAVQFPDGRLAVPPIALCEVQGYAYEAALHGAEILDAFGAPGAQKWRDFAGRLAANFRARFWVEDGDGPYPAIALQADGTPVGSLTSNIGHLLGTGMLSAEERDLVARRLRAPDLGCGYGLRTLAASSKGFNPMSYHCGSVWPHDTAIAIAGLARTGSRVADEAADALIDGLLSAAEAFAYRVPELFSGHDRTTYPAPLPYPAACRPQGWSAAASVSLLTSLLGLEADMPHRRLTVSPMAAAAGLRKVSGLRAGGSQVTVNVGADGHALVTGLPPGTEVVAPERAERG